MASYVTQQELIDRFGEDELIQLTDRATPPAGVIDGQVLNSAIADASGLIEDYVGGRYQLPLAVVPRSLVRIAGDLARYFLYGDAAPEQVRTRYDDALKFLTAVSRGDVQLGLSAGGGEAQGDNSAQIQSSGRTFDRDSAKDFI